MSEERTQTAPAGWFTDPVNRSLLRWWDGTFWTTSIFDPQDIPAPAPVPGREDVRRP